jgi:type VI secretion system protein
MQGGMMALRLTITSYHKVTPGQRPEMVLETGVITLGRASDNDWVLPDPERLVSSRHCTIQFKESRYYLTDNSTNGVELVHAGVRMRRGNSEPLNDGEVIRIGEYEIQVHLENALPMAGVPEAHSFEALMANQVSAQDTPITGAMVAHLQGALSHETLPDLFDFLGPSSVPPSSHSDHIPAQQHGFSPPRPVECAPLVQPQPATASLIPADWDLPGDTPVQEAPPSITPPLPDPLLEKPQASAVQPEPAAAFIPEPSLETSDLLRAFLRGAGIEHLRIDTADAQRQMETIGRSYRLMVEGLIDVLRARSSLKGEFRMQQTTIAPVQNNPLKFAPNADEALLLLLRHDHSTFLPPDQAAKDSFDDLRVHQLAVMAGVEAAIKNLLARFEPARLEQRLAPPSGLSKVFGGSRQAHCWEQFTKLYQQLSQEAEDDFQELFGREFSRAYEAHSNRTQRS